MTAARPVLAAAVILAGPIAVFCVLGALPFGYVSWLGSGFAGIVGAMALPGLACIATLKLPWLIKGTAAMLYLAVYTPICIMPAAFATCLLVGCSV